MHPLQSLIRITHFIGNNFAHNLGYIPEDKINFKPSPTAKSAMEITKDAAENLLNTKARLTGGDFGDVPVSVPTTRAEAQELITRAANEYAEWLPTLAVSQFGEPIQLPFAVMPFGQVLTMPIVDLVHHHGQIAYIQTILGDTENHFFRMGIE